MAPPRTARAPRPAPLLLPVLLLMATAVAQAQSLFTCTTRDGRNLRGEFPPRECADVEIRELNRDGSVKRRIPAPLTQAEKERLAEEQRRQLEVEEAVRQQRRRDRALLEAYGSEAEIEAMRERTLANRRALIERTERRLEDLRKERKRLDSEAEFYEKRQMPDKLRRAFENNAQIMRQEQKILDDTRVELNRMNDRFDAEKRRFRQLLELGATPAPRQPEKSD